METTPDLFTPPAAVQATGIPEGDIEAFRAHLTRLGTWQTREQCARALGWKVRYVRRVAEALGCEVVRCQLGYLLFDQVPFDELCWAQQAANAAESQASKQTAYALGLRKRIHARIG